VSGQRKALIVAVDEYDQEALRNLLAPAADAEALGRVLGDRQIGEFTVQVVRNEPAHVIEGHIEELFSESRSDDVLLVHFSGHGLKSESGELFFAASNTRPNRLGSTAVSADFVQRCMRASRSRSVVLLLDCCYGGAFSQGAMVRASGDANVLDSFPQEGTGGGRGRVVITASSAMEYAFEGEQLADDQLRRPSVFTNALVEGLATGDADRDEDGWVSLNELYDYVFDKVREQNPHQTPSRKVELEGDLYLAHSRRQRIRPAPIPPDLQAALTDQNMYTRLGAISELQSRLSSDNLPTAVGAYEALAELARTDIRYVADPAAAALSQGALHPEETVLHFGDHRQGSAPPHRTLRLLGPPIARACTSRASGDWIRVDETAEGFDISVDTATTGVLRGTLDLKGPTGEAIIAIDIELVSSPPQEAEQAAARAEEQARQEAEQAAARGAEEHRSDKTRLFTIVKPDESDAPSQSAQPSPMQMTRESTLHGLYMQALAAMRVGRPADAITLLDSLLALDPDYRDAADRRDASRRSQRSAANYERGRAAEAAGNWASAVAEYTAITDAEPDYRDVSKRLADCTKHQQIAGLLEELRMHARASEWRAVIAISDELTALGAKSSEVDRAAKTARQQIRREEDESHVETERPERRGLAARLAAVASGRLRREQPVEGTGPRRSGGESRLTGGKWRIFYAPRFPVLGSIMIAVPLFVLALEILQVISINTPTPYLVVTILGLAGISGSVIDYRNGCGIPAVAVGVNSAWISGYFALLTAWSSSWLSDNRFILLTSVVTGVGFIGNGVILAYILRPFNRPPRRTVDAPLLVFLVFMTVGLVPVCVAFALSSLSRITSAGSRSLLWVAGVMFLAALLSELTGIVLAVVRGLQDTPRSEGGR
jgi:tetratricopeptide (TPR) repeat protein